MSLSPIDTLSLACPSGGKMYICQGNATQFIGCCTSNPCGTNKGSCPQADVKPTTFDKLDYQDILAQDCASDTADWYACSALATPFMGCCKSNACTTNGGCPANDLVAAQLGNDTQARKFLSATLASSTTTVRKTATLTSVKSTGTAKTSSVAAAMTTAAAAASSTGTAEPVSSVPAGGLSTGVKAGLGIGAVALIVIVAVTFFLIRRALLKKKFKSLMVRGSSTPSTPSMMRYSPARVTYDDPNQIRYTHSVNTQVRPSLPTKTLSSTIYSASSSSSTEFLSRETSLRSTTTSNNALGLRSGSPASAQYHPHGAGSQQFLYTSPAMGILAELDGSDAFPSPAVSEMAGPTPVSTTRPSMPSQTYRAEP